MNNEKGVEFIISIMMIWGMSISVLASDNINQQSKIEYFDDGSYIVTTLSIEDEISTYATKTKTATKSITYERFRW